jgi:kynurenine formamidase
MTIHDLSMPVWEGAPYGEVLPFTNSSVRFTEYMFYETHGIRRTQMKLDRETASPLITIAPASPFSRAPSQPNAKHHYTISDIPLDLLVLRETTILDIPAEAGHEITADEVEAALAVADFRPGDDILLRSGWGTTERAFTTGNEYYTAGPSLRHEAGQLLARRMDEMDSHFFMTDLGLLNPPRVQGHNWFTGDTPIVPLPKPWPSAEARERKVDLNGKTHASSEPSSFQAIIPKAVAIAKCLVDCNQIVGNRFKSIILPLLIRDAGAFTTRIFAVED